jgi:succinate-acetate transporter protein
MNSTIMKRFINLLMLFILITVPTELLAQPGLPTNPEQTPIDGGLGILAALGGAYGIKKMRESKE